jgi:1-acyl-sn-glycerol-3-phosphate acyltransferase
LISRKQLWRNELVNSSTTESTSLSPRNRFFKRYENQVEQYGFDPKTYIAVERFLRFLYKKWFRVQIAGLENIPGTGAAVLFGNHSGTLPVDACLLYDGIINSHSQPRRLRFLVTKFLMNSKVPGDFLRGFGCIPPDYEAATNLLNKQELVLFYPEAEAGTGKLYKHRYKLVDFHAGFVRAAIATGSPLIPIVTIGGDEIYPNLGNIKPLAKFLRFPYFPMTPFFPWLPFPFNLVPIPVKIMICVWPSFELPYPKEAAEDEELVAQIADDIRADLQVKVNDLLAMRRSPFKAWNMTQVNDYLKRTPSYERHIASR